MKQSFAVRMNLRQGDVVIVPKSEWNLVAHYVVYWGMDINGTHWYLENNSVYGVRWITEEIFLAENPTYKRIRLFKGSDYDRSVAINRATLLVGNTYDLEKFNCENYANYVQYGVSYSKQVDTVKGVVTGSLLLGLIVLVAAGLSSRY